MGSNRGWYFLFFLVVVVWWLWVWLWLWLWWFWMVLGGLIKGSWVDFMKKYPS